MKEPEPSCGTVQYAHQLHALVSSEMLWIQKTMMVNHIISKHEAFRPGVHKPADDVTVSLCTDSAVCDCDSNIISARRAAQFKTFPQQPQPQLLNLSSSSFF